MFTATVPQAGEKGCKKNRFLLYQSSSGSYSKNPSPYQDTVQAEHSYGRYRGNVIYASGLLQGWFFQWSTYSTLLHLTQKWELEEDILKINKSQGRDIYCLTQKKILSNSDLYFLVANFSTSRYYAFVFLYSKNKLLYPQTD